jgi:hypothetical protein
LTGAGPSAASALVVKVEVYACASALPARSVAATVTASWYALFSTSGVVGVKVAVCWE